MRATGSYFERLARVMRATPIDALQRPASETQE